MPLGDCDLDLFLDDFGITVEFDGVGPVTVTKEEYDEKVTEGDMGTSSIGRVKALTGRADQLAEVRIGGTLTIDAVQYWIRQVLLIHDGKYRHVLLSDEEVS